MAVQGKTVGIMGAGISGMAACKELKELGIECEVFEMMPMIGGVFAHYGWKGGKLTSSSVFTWYSDFPIQDRQRHLSWPEWLAYLQSYCDHFQINDRISLNCKVESVTRNPKGGWNMKIHRKNWSNGSWQHPENIDVKEEVFEKHFDVLVASSGLHNRPRIPMYEGADDFKKMGGNVIHSSDFQDPDVFKDKRVCVVGAGESASDIAWLTSQVASQVAISMRNPPGTMFPHRIHGDTADIRDNRLFYSLPRATAPWVTWAHKQFYTGKACMYKDEFYRKADFDWAAKCNYDNNNCIFTTNACKSFGIPQAVNRNGATTHKGIKKFEDKTVYFEDGSKFENCDTVICCSGYYLEIEAMKNEEFHESFRDPRSFWKSMVSPDIEDFFLVGFLRPHQINLVSCAEMQARAMALVVSGKKSLAIQGRDAGGRQGVQDSHDDLLHQHPRARSGRFHLLHGQPR
jgi:dimethylaniline monooxygenase (N-oxide forming)